MSSTRILTIAVITMNRAAQLKEALESCLACHLPKETEFIVIDNASTDDTEATVKSVLQNAEYPFYYEKLTENLGVGGGRNYAYEKSVGEYIYALDDDAVIDFEKNPDFFLRAIDIFEEHPSIVTLTTQIYDTAWEKNRLDPSGNKLANGLQEIYMFCGGSHFLRRSFYPNAPYLPNKYGFEEIPPSLCAMNAKKINAFCKDLLVIHKPAINKWVATDKGNAALRIKAVAITYAIKKMMYPVLSLPLLRMATWRRIKKHLSDINDGKKTVKAMSKEFIKDYPLKREIKTSTVIRMFKKFKLSVF